MPSLANHSSLQLVKALYLGDPGAGKTGSLTSLVDEGYKLRVYDFDNLLTPLVQYVSRTCPDKLDTIKFQTFTDKMKGRDNPLVFAGKSIKVMPMTDGQPKAFINAMKQLSRWNDDGEDLGDPGTWGPEYIVVIDSFTRLAEAAMRYVQAFNPAGQDPRQDFYSAQQLLQNVLALLFSEEFSTNVIVLAHITYREDHLGVTKGLPKSIGAALSESLASYFNCVLMADKVGTKRIIRTNNHGLVQLKNPVSFRVPDELPLETGLATFFKAVTSTGN